MLASGKQIEIACDGHRAIVTSVGATLREYQVDGRPVIDGFDPDEMSPSGRGQVLIPWPNRVAGGHYEFEGAHYDLAIDERSLGHAIDGLVRWANWRVEEADGSVARLRHSLHAHPGYPFELELEIDYRVSASGLTATMGATNVGRTPCPFGAGAHPYLVFPESAVDAVKLCVRAEEWLDVDARSIPIGHRPVGGGPLDYRQPRAIGTARIDHAFAHLERDAGVWPTSFSATRAERSGCGSSVRSTSCRSTRGIRYRTGRAVVAAWRWSP